MKGKCMTLDWLESHDFEEALNDYIEFPSGKEFIKLKRLIRINSHIIYKGAGEYKDVK